MKTAIYFNFNKIRKFFSVESIEKLSFSIMSRAAAEMKCTIPVGWGTLEKLTNARQPSPPQSFLQNGNCDSVQATRSLIFSSRLYVCFFFQETLLALKTSSFPKPDDKEREKDCQTLFYCILIENTDSLLSLYPHILSQSPISVFDLFSFLQRSSRRASISRQTIVS